MVYEINKGDQVWIRDYPLGRPLSIYGKVVAILDDSHCNVLLLNGMNEGKIKKYKFWSVSKKNRECEKQQKKEQVLVMDTDGQ